MNFEELKKRKDELFIRIMRDKYERVETPAMIVKEYRFLQREEKRMIKSYKESKVA
jgi:hypothetical protein